MMKIDQFYDFLDTLSPFSSQAKWDNSGLLVGNRNDSFKQVYFSLDLDEAMLSQIEPHSLIVTHHPLIFSPLKTINYDTYATKLLQQLIQKEIALICMHTNFDQSHLNCHVATEVLGWEVIEQRDFIVYADINQPFDTFYNDITQKLHLPFTKMVKCHDHVQRVALVTGSGASLLNEVHADCLLTGDIKYHDAMEAQLRKISLIDIGHYESERYFSSLLYQLCENYLKKNKLQAIITDSKNPFCYTTRL